MCSRTATRDAAVSASSGGLPAKSTPSWSSRKKKRIEKKSSEGDSNGRSGNSKGNEQTKSTVKEIDQAHPGPVESPSIIGLESVGPSLDNPEAVPASETCLLGRNSEMSDPICRIITLEPQNVSTIHLLGKQTESQVSDSNRDDAQKSV